MSKLLPLLVLSVFTACQSDNLSPGSQTVLLQAGQTMSVGGLVVTFPKVVSDARCPMGAMCAAGHVNNVVIALRATPFWGGPDTSGELNLDVSPTSWTFAGRTIQFVQVDPLPPHVGETIAPGDYRATLRVTRAAP
jgi:hypothetical protein